MLLGQEKKSLNAHNHWHRGGMEARNRCSGKKQGQGMNGGPKKEKARCMIVGWQGQRWEGVPGRD